MRTVRTVLAMSENATNDNPDREEERDAFLQAAAKILSEMPTVASTLVSFAALAAVVGWIQARAYYSQFGAAWIVSKLSTVEIVSFSWLPIAMLLVFMWLGVTDLEEGGRRRMRNTKWILRHGWIVVLMLIAISALSTKFELRTMSTMVAIIMVVAYAFFAGAAFEGLVIAFRYGTGRWRVHHSYLAVAVVIFGLFLVPIQIGRTRAKMDLDPKRSTLPTVVVSAHPEDNYRLLLCSAGNASAVRFDEEGKAYPKIFVLDVGDVEYLQGSGVDKARDADK